MPGQVVVGGASSSAIRVVCAWCGALLRASRHVNAMTSHGMCPACVEQMAHVDEDSDVAQERPRPENR